MRGILIKDIDSACFDGITPAHAGNTIIIELLELFPRDHPRTCGEYRARGAALPHSSGSPPHMRGIPFFTRAQRCKARITPAHAGNTPPDSVSRSMTWDHPRTCGEYRFEHRGGGTEVGSPPHMRGILIRAAESRIELGITPAHAGNAEYAA